MGNLYVSSIHSLGGPSGRKSCYELRISEKRGDLDFPAEVEARLAVFLAPADYPRFRAFLPLPSPAGHFLL